ncbi:hypothetical protein MNBD_ALPHA06-1892 [hydrothermal vent metagenome]|uniref:Thioredoxin domain-containing protein n=1 Tax=hydrothermal vent metagenome TaxID=652676 RepID=A0A3B0SHV3_9ZZZZ
MFRFLIVFLGLVSSFGFASSAQADQPSYDGSRGNPVVRAVYFHADWCANCRILQPELDKAKVSGKNLPVQHITLDFTNPQTWDAAIEIALDNNVVAAYNAYAGTTGLVVLVAGDTGEQIDCVNRLYTAPAMVHAFENAVQRVRSTQPGNRNTGSIVCPPSRMAP